MTAFWCAETGEWTFEPELIAAAERDCERRALERLRREYRPPPRPPSPPPEAEPPRPAAPTQTTTALPGRPAFGRR